MKCGLCLKIWNRSFVCVIQLLNTEYCDLVLKPILEISNMLVFKYCKINQSTKQYKSTKVQNIYLHGACSQKCQKMPKWQNCANIVFFLFFLGGIGGQKKSKKYQKVPKWPNFAKIVIFWGV